TIRIYLLWCPAQLSSDIYTLSLHDALPISGIESVNFFATMADIKKDKMTTGLNPIITSTNVTGARTAVSSVLVMMGFKPVVILRSEEHTSELQSRFDLVCRLLLEKKNTRHR